MSETLSTFNFVATFRSGLVSFEVHPKNAPGRIYIGPPATAAKVYRDISELMDSTSYGRVARLFRQKVDGEAVRGELHCSSLQLTEAGFQQLHLQ